MIQLFLLLNLFFIIVSMLTLYAIGTMFPSSPMTAKEVVAVKRVD